MDSIDRQLTHPQFYVWLQKKQHGVVQNVKLEAFLPPIASHWLSPSRTDTPARSILHYVSYRSSPYDALIPLCAQCCYRRFIFIFVFFAGHGSYQGQTKTLQSPLPLFHNKNPESSQPWRKKEKRKVLVLVLSVLWDDKDWESLIFILKSRSFFPSLQFPLVCFFILFIFVSLFVCR